ncbi:MAG: hypothetical protein LBL62_06245 [Planctomycetaceae bacterium]|jgi:hypothetical protein|nr:hypothetical protein [Planctomycetaceae bacterium]
MTTVRIKNKIDTKKVKKRIQKANFKSIDHAAAYFRKSVINSIRRGKEKDGKRIPSDPNKPPKTWSNPSRRFMKRNIGYKTVSDIYGKSIATIYTSPNKTGDPVFQLLERGGSQTVKVYRDIVDERKTRGSYSAYRPLNERSKKEQDAINNYYDNVRTEKEKKVKVKAFYPKRPYMQPVIKKILPRLPKIWETNIKQNFH